MNTAVNQPDINEIRAVYLCADDLKVAASILYKAYYDDPLFNDIFDIEREGYDQRLRSAIREELNAFWDAKQPMIGLFEHGRLLAVACLISPDAAFGTGRYWHWQLKMLLTAGFLGTKQMIAKEEKVREAIPSKDYHMLSFIGVHPDHQNIGLGYILMRGIFGLLQEDNKTDGVGVFVTVPKSLSFFKDAQFELIKEIEVGQVSGKVMFRKKLL